MTIDEIAAAAHKARGAGDMDEYFRLLDAYDAALRPAVIRRVRLPKRVRRGG